ncbi:peroxiredoxin [Actinokineospora spheciospongiae]|uniref:peroxiredoxin n=1 Tax=Actinokineospora spheciospongiae TaxID=909613 RepID=UPI000D71D50D|nr:peroxiredoxin [Actinokineospora spheciospongiae]PWW63317.1 peroxiredoxin Q/BCP [Actinokineospora spheciospongiae]
MDKGDIAPDFKLVDQDGNPRSLGEFLELGPLALFFYPAAMTTGCTAQSCHFRDLAAEFAEVGAQRVGISSDGVDKQREFSDAHSFGFPLLSDPDGAVAAAYGVRRKLGLPDRFGAVQTRRRTIVIDTDRTVLAVVKSELRMEVHADQALAALRARAGK